MAFLLAFVPFPESFRKAGKKRKSERKKTVGEKSRNRDSKGEKSGAFSCSVCMHEKKINAHFCFTINDLH